MKATELIGKKAIRKAPCDYGELKDYSHASSPILIVNATDTNIVYKYPDEQHPLFKDGIFGLDSRWCDNNWTDYDLLLTPLPKWAADIGASA